MTEHEPAPLFQVVSSADIMAEPTHPLMASFWATRQPGQSYTAWRVARAIEELEARAVLADCRAARATAEAENLRAQAQHLREVSHDD